MPWLIQVRADSGRCWSMCTAVHGSAADMAAQSPSHSYTLVLLPRAMGSESQRANHSSMWLKRGRKRISSTCVSDSMHITTPPKLPSAE